MMSFPIAFDAAPFHSYLWDIIGFISQHSDA
jgi:hypothetical protein